MLMDEIIREVRCTDGRKKIGEKEFLFEVLFD